MLPPFPHTPTTTSGAVDSKVLPNLFLVNRAGRRMESQLNLLLTGLFFTSGGFFLRSAFGVSHRPWCSLLMGGGLRTSCSRRMWRTLMTGLLPRCRVLMFCGLSTSYGLSMSCFILVGARRRWFIRSCFVLIRASRGCFVLGRFVLRWLVFGGLIGRSRLFGR